jgi:hypothetical protein
MSLGACSVTPLANFDSLIYSPDEDFWLIVLRSIDIWSIVIAFFQINFL